MSTIVLLVDAAAVSAPFLSRVRGITGAPLGEIRERIQSRKPLWESAVTLSRRPTGPIGWTRSVNTSRRRASASSRPDEGGFT